MAATARAGLRYPALTDTPDVVRDIQNLASDVDAVAVMYKEDTFANRPAAGKHGRLFYATDTGNLYYDYGSAWLLLTPTVVPGAGSITAAMLAASVPIVPIGGMFDWPWGSADAPSWALLPVGQALTKTTYTTLAALAASAGYLYGGTSGGTTFSLPDMRARVAAGADDMGGSAAGRITIGVSGTAGGLGAIAGAEGVVLTTAQIPAHNHPINDPGHTHTFWEPLGSGGPGSSGYPGTTRTGTQTSSSTTGITAGNTGGGGAHVNLQPTVFVNKLLRVL